MKTTVNQDNLIQLEEVYNPIVLKTSSGEELVISMRDSGFEFNYQGEMYFAKEGHVKPFNKSVRGNYLVDQTPQCSVDVVASEKKLKEMSELHKPKVRNGASDFYLAWRLCYEWIFPQKN